MLILDGTKLKWHNERLRAWMNGERIAPITIDCALTRSCSYNCVYCYGKLQENERHTLSKEVIFNFLSDAAEIGVKAISFLSDGESTLSPHIYDAIEFGKVQGLDMALGTNGWALDPNELWRMLQNLTYLRFNISAALPDRYAFIHGVSEKDFDKVLYNIKESVRLKVLYNLPVTIGLQMVLMPQHGQDILPLAELGRELGVDYLVIKHCSDDENGALGVDYSKYKGLEETLKQAEAMSTSTYRVSAKWSKIMSGGKKCYSKCYAAPFMLQMSGSGLVAPCGFLFNDQYKEKFHIGNIAETRFKEIFKSDRYWEVMNYLVSKDFDARRDCGTLCLQHKVNEFLYGIVPTDPSPEHINFI